jgi:hypothetical protein
LKINIETIKSDLSSLLNLGLCPKNVSIAAGGEYNVLFPSFISGVDYQRVPIGTNIGMKWLGNRIEVGRSVILGPDGKQVDKKK